MKKNLVAYFSRTGEQYGVGNITEGNTAILAQMIAKKADADVFEIKVIDDKYPNTYSELVQFAKEEKRQNARPDIEGDLPIDENYENIFLGYPNWWSDMPMPVYTFIEKYGFQDRNIYHFCTHEGSGGVYRDGFALFGHIAQNNREEAEKKIDEWLARIL